MRLVLAKQAPRPRLENRRTLRRALEEGLRCVGLADHAAADTELHVVMIDDKRMADLNEHFLGHAGSTDVLAFPFAEAETAAIPGETRIAGEIYLCLDVAVAAATEYGNSLGEECVLYAVHGMLHLAGMDDQTPHGRRDMKAAEGRLLDALREKFDLRAIFGC